MRESSTGGAASRRRSGSCLATDITEISEFVDELERNYHRVDGYSLKRSWAWPVNERELRLRPS